MKNRQVALVQRCLWEFQEMTPEIEGLVLVDVEAVILASTLSYSESMSRIASVASTLVTLARQVSEAWEQGDFHEVRVRYRDHDQRLRDAQLIAVTDRTVLLVVLERAKALNLTGVTVLFNTRQALEYVSQILNGVNNPPPANWL